jgi:PAS domain S-box-containing protein
MTFEQALTNGYFYGMCLSALACFVVVMLVARRAHSSAAIVWFQLYLSSIFVVTLLSIAQFFRMSSNDFVVLMALIALTVVIIFTSQFFFIMYFVGRADVMKRWWVVGIIATIDAAFLFISWNYHGFVFSDTVTHRLLKPWGYVDTGHVPGFNFISAYTGLFALSSSAALIIAYFRTSNPDRRRQVLIVMLAVVLPTVLGVVVQGILPQHGIYVLPVGAYATTIAALLIAYMLIHYGTASIDPGAITASIVQTMNSPAVALDRNHRIIFANAATKALFGYSQAEIIDKPIGKLFGRETGKEFAQYLHHDQKSGGTGQAFESKVVGHDGKQTAVNIYSSYYRDKEGRTLASILVFADVQRLQDLKAGVEQTVIERTRELHEEQAKLLASIEGLPNGFVLVDSQQRILLQNKKLQTIFNLKKAGSSVEQLGTHLAGVDLAEICKKVQEQKEPVVVGEVGLGPKILRLFLGPVRVKDKDTDTVIGVVMLVEDITEEKILARSKDEFFSIASHELRTPLTAIKGNTSMLMRYFPEVLKKPDVKEIVSDIHESSTHLIDIVNDFLDISRIEQGKISFTYSEFSLEPLIEKVIYEMHALLSEKKLHIKFDKMTLNSLPKVWADESRTKQVLYNLVGNAAKFTEEGGISIGAGIANGHVKVTVTDTGRGLSPKNQQLLFHKFQQANTSLLTRDTTRGTGLGLYISKRLIESMNGVIKLEKSEEGKGSTFSFTLPIATPELVQAAPEPAQT